MAAFAGAEALFRRTLAIRPRALRAGAALVALAAAPLGLVAAAAELGALVLVLVAALGAEASGAVR